MMTKVTSNKTIELLSPARNLKGGIAAITYGADAVYIGAERFGARAAARNSLGDIATLVEFAHQYYAKVYVTINTLITDSELNEVETLIHKLHGIGVDAIIIQDAAILEMSLPAIPIFTSTQFNSTTAEKIQFQKNIGIQRVILPREFSLTDIRSIHKKVDIELEYFIHGALCVSYSGQCYFSHSIGKGSANRGECSQPCRAYYTLESEDGQIIAKNKYLLSLKDLDLSNHLGDLINAGITSFKIEGRLKDINYVKNITAYYRKMIDNLLNKDLRKSSSGKVKFDFEPDPERSFTRGTTDYFIGKRNSGQITFDSQKSIGKKIATISELRESYYEIRSTEMLSNGDGICYFDSNGNLDGFGINHIQNDRIYPDRYRSIKKGTVLYRNFDIRFSDQLKNSKTTRKIDVMIRFQEIPTGFRISAEDEDGIEASVFLSIEKTMARNSEFSNVITRQLSKCGNTIFHCKEVKIEFVSHYFFQLNELNEIRRKVLDELFLKRVSSYQRKESTIVKNNFRYPLEKINDRGNVINRKAKDFYERHGIAEIEVGFDLPDKAEGKEIMRCKYCVKFELGLCPKETPEAQFSNKNILFLKDNCRTYKLTFDCKACNMKINFEE